MLKELSHYSSATELWFGDLDGCVQCSLSLSELPNTDAKIAEVAGELLEFAYYWFSNAAGKLRWCNWESMN